MLDTHLATLQKKHSGLDDKIRLELARPVTDTGRIRQFKLEKLLSDPQWKSVISLLQATEFMSILQKVMLDFDKVDVAQLLCPHVELTCSYAVAILGSVSNWLRIQFIQTMLPHIVDLEMNKDVLLRELSDWERITTERELENALMRRNGSRSM